MNVDSLDYFTLIKDIGFPIAVTWFVLTRAGLIAKQLVEAHVAFIAALGASQSKLELGQDTTNDLLVAQTHSLGLIHHLLTQKAPAA